jgi:hypothetical protein
MGGRGEREIGREREREKGRERERETALYTIKILFVIELD